MRGAGALCVVPRLARRGMGQGGRDGALKILKAASAAIRDAVLGSATRNSLAAEWPRGPHNETPSQTLQFLHTRRSRISHFRFQSPSAIALTITIATSTARSLRPRRPHTVHTAVPQTTAQNVATRERRMKSKIKDNDLRRDGRAATGVFVMTRRSRPMILHSQRGGRQGDCPMTRPPNVLVTDGDRRFRSRTHLRARYRRQTRPLGSPYFDAECVGASSAPRRHGARSIVSGGAGWLRRSW
jgi:hypothetical protein